MKRLVFLIIFTHLTFESKSQADLWFDNAYSGSMSTIPAYVGEPVGHYASVSNSGDATVASIQTDVRCYLSSDNLLSPDDELMGSALVPLLEPGTGPALLEFDYTFSQSQAGSKYIIFVIDEDDLVKNELSESNNIIVIPKKIGRADLWFDNAYSGSMSTIPAYVGEPVGHYASVSNSGDATVASVRTDVRCYLSSDNLLSPDDELMGSAPVPLLEPGTGPALLEFDYTFSQSQAGSKYIIFVVDEDDLVKNELSENNNIVVIQKEIIGQEPDFVITNLSGPNSADRGNAISITFRVRNQGDGLGNAGYARVYLSGSSSSIVGATELGNFAVGNLGAGSSSSAITINGTVPASYPTGSKYIIAIADADDNTTELSENNNRSNLPITIGLSERPDLIVTSPYLDGAGSQAEFIENESYNIDLIVYNTGAISSPETEVKIYWSENADLDVDNDFFAGVKSIPVIDPNKNSGELTTTMNTPPKYSTNPWEQWRVIFVVDPDNTVAEEDEGNNESDTYLVTLNSSSSGGRIGKKRAQVESIEFHLQNTVKVMDLHGRTIWERENVEEALDFDSLPKGLYLFQTMEGSRMKTEKIFKK